MIQSVNGPNFKGDVQTQQKEKPKGLKEKYNELSPEKQKMIKVASVALTALAIGGIAFATKKHLDKKALDGVKQTLDETVSNVKPKEIKPEIKPKSPTDKAIEIQKQNGSMNPKTISQVINEKDAIDPKKIDEINAKYFNNVNAATGKSAEESADVFIKKGLTFAEQNQAQESAQVFIKNGLTKTEIELDNADKALNAAIGPKYQGDTKEQITATFLKHQTSAEKELTKEAALERVANEGKKTTESAIKRKVSKQTKLPGYQRNMIKLQNKSDGALKDMLNSSKTSPIQRKVIEDILSSRKK